MLFGGQELEGCLLFFNESLNFGRGNGTPRFNPFFIPKLISDIPAGYISIKYNLRGPNFTTVSLPASSTNALIDAFNYIKWNKQTYSLLEVLSLCLWFQV